MGKTNATAEIATTRQLGATSWHVVGFSLHESTSPLYLALVPWILANGGFS